MPTKTVFAHKVKISHYVKCPTSCRTKSLNQCKKCDRHLGIMNDYVACSWEKEGARGVGVHE